MRSWRTMNKRRKRHLSPVQRFGRWLKQEREARWEYEDKLLLSIMSERPEIFYANIEVEERQLGRS